LALEEAIGEEEEEGDTMAEDQLRDSEGDQGKLNLF
jgi:hypothetical protein